ncbi:hypothetical protein Taro_050545, partial [Colocasia esculenta]|nr:hypothetical protein [Colocasia esculenta]
MAPLLRASAPRFHPFLPRQAPRNLATVVPALHGGGGGGFSNCRCFGIGTSRQFLPPLVNASTARGLAGGSRLCLPVEVGRVQAVGGAGFAAVTAVGNSGGFLMSFLSWYLNALNRYPVSMKSITSALLTLVGDLICQLMIDNVPELDLKRIFVFTFLGLVLVGPTLHFWYLYLSKLVTVQGPSGALLRLLLDQASVFVIFIGDSGTICAASIEFVFSPIFIGVFLSSLITLEGRPSQVLPKLQQEWFSSVLANWKLWIPFQFLNFWFVPQQFQVLAANFVALVWNVILSFKAHREIEQKTANSWRIASFAISLGGATPPRGRGISLAPSIPQGCRKVHGYEFC